MECIKDQFYMESGWYGPNYEEDFQDIVEGVKKLEFYFILWIYENVCITEWSGYNIKFTGNQVEEIWITNNIFKILLK